MPRVKALGVGETWFVQLPNSTGCVKVTIDELTERTVVFTLLKDGTVGYSGKLSRYVRREIKFVERVPQ